MNRIFGPLFDLFAKLLTAVLTVVCLIVVPFWQAIVLGLAGDTFGTMLAGLLWFPLFVLAFSVHELGHLAAGLLLKFNPRQLVLGVFCFQKGPKRWEAHFHRDWNRAPALVRFDLPLDPRMGFRFAVMLCGGPLANLLWFGLCLGLAVFFYHVPPFGNILTHLKGLQPTGAAGQFLWFPANRFTAVLNEAAFLSLFYALAPLVPGYGLAMKTDGLQLWELWRHGRIGNLIFLKSWPAHLGPMPTTPGRHHFPKPQDDVPPASTQ